MSSISSVSRFSPCTQFFKEHKTALTITALAVSAIAVTVFTGGLAMIPTFCAMLSTKLGISLLAAKLTLVGVSSGILASIAVLTSKISKKHIVNENTSLQTSGKSQFYDEETKKWDLDKLKSSSEVDFERKIPIQLNGKKISSFEELLKELNLEEVFKKNESITPEKERAIQFLSFLNQTSFNHAFSHLQSKKQSITYAPLGINRKLIANFSSTTQEIKLEFVTSIRDKENPSQIIDYKKIDFTWDGKKESLTLSTKPKWSQISGKFSKTISYNDQLGLLKASCKDPSDIEDFNAEKEILKLLSGSPNIVQIMNKYDSEDAPIVMEFCKNGDLLGAFNAEKISDETKEKILSDIANGLKEMHELKILHRDLKPENIFLREDFTAVIGDLGLAHLVEDKIKTESSRGDVRFRPPEQIPQLLISPEEAMKRLLKGQSSSVKRNLPASEKTDIWSLGCIFYQTLTNCPFIPQSNPDEESKIITSLTQDTIDKKLEYVPEKYRPLLRQMFNLNPENRPSAAEILTTLSSL